ncbi:hypothetical protein [Novosphingobium sp. fls2-241-R2A-195]|jgi:hypothetical protein|uniref:hypothetical protein n=1 Tax=Novosphingobium sp. fls2-241-R2A-195 TaxID=3040296 RepID=UPI00254FFFF6|nr:hypothetical protein [Novosphingobium sp. fls2-241-R2A-195]
MPDRSWRWACVLPAAFICAPAQAEEPVTIGIEPYLWAPSIDGSVSLGPLVLPIDLKPVDLASGLKMGAMGRVSLEKGPAFAAVEMIGVDFQRDAFAPTLGQDVAVRAVAAELTGGYRFAVTPDVDVTPIAGLRYNYLKVHFGQVPAAIAVRGEWMEPAIGLQLAARPLRRVSVQGKVLAGRRSGDRHSLDVRADVSYALRPWVQVFAGYRHMKQDFASPGPVPFAIDLGADGPLVGVRARF